MPIEPHADMRKMAAIMMQTYVAFREQGFTEGQAMYLIGQMIQAQRPPQQE